jgi:4-hydroxy 2-oxovalerate aldolase
LYNLFSDSITLLDCTFRDGGYYNNWNFDANLVTDYLELCARLEINLVEIGYLRLQPNSQSSGPFANIPDALSPDLLRIIETFPELPLAAMIEVKELLKLPQTEVAAMIAAKLHKSNIPLKALRFAVHFAQCASLGDYVQQLHDEGYAICINLMQIDMATPEQIDQCLEILSRLPLTCVYLADSLGSMMPKKVSQLTRQFSDRLHGAIGFHAHDNRGLALHNSLTAVEAGATWIDSTIHGMGRGAGNAKTEQIMSLFRPDTSLQQQLDLYQFAARYFNPLHKTYGWGASPFYGIAGLSQIHPNYVHEIENNADLSTEDKLMILQALGKQKSNAFSNQILEEVIYAET